MDNASIAGREQKRADAVADDTIHVDQGFLANPDISFQKGWPIRKLRALFLSLSQHW